MDKEKKLSFFFVCIILFNPNFRTNRAKVKYIFCFIFFLRKQFISQIFQNMILASRTDIIFDEFPIFEQLQRRKGRDSELRRHFGWFRARIQANLDARNLRNFDVISQKSNDVFAAASTSLGRLAVSNFVRGQTQVPTQRNVVARPRGVKLNERILVLGDFAFEVVVKTDRCIASSEHVLLLFDYRS